MVRFAQQVLSTVAMLCIVAIIGAPVRASSVTPGRGFAAGGLERGERSAGTSKSRAAARARTAKAQHLKSRSKRAPVTAPVTAPGQQTPGRVTTREIVRDDVPQPGRRTASPPAPPQPGQADVPPNPSVGDAGTTATPFDVVQLAGLRPVFRRSSQLPPSIANRDEIALGERLFSEPKLSADHKMSCATCHDPERAFIDGRAKARGDKGQALPRNTPPLWNLAWQKRFYWDARADSLEGQVKDAVEREGEMDGTLQAAAYWLSQDATYAADFQRVYRADVLARPDLITKAIAAYERTLVSPETSFDRWAAGDDRALSPEELAGLRIFTGKGRCLACHGGWRFTDDDVHDIGLRSTDRGAAALTGSKAADRTFKTPSLREISWTGPYMHDGSLTTLEAVLDHYTRRLERRPSLAPELRQPLILAPAERSDLLAFLRTLSSDRLPRAP